MQFFKLVGAFAAGSGGQDRKRTADENVDLLAAKSEAFNKGLRGRAFFYVVNASGGTFTAMAVQKDPRMNMDPQFPAYTEALGVKLTDIHAEEISLHTACNLLHRASRNDYIEDDDDVLKTLDLDYMVNQRFSDFRFWEDLMDEACKDEIYAKAERLFTKDCLLPELDRIYAGGASAKIVGHPVHYLIQTDDAGIRREMIQSLLPSLYANGRLQNRRYSSVYFRGEALYGKSSDYDQFYKSNAGGTVIVQYSADYGDTDEDTTDGIRDTIEKLCSYIKKYRHQVLTILCLPRECTKLKELFYENLGTVSFVELKEEFAVGERAGDYLKLLARDNHVRTDKKLFAKLEGNRGYLAPELRTIFDGWYNGDTKWNFENDTITGNVTLKAHWIQTTNQYTVTFNSDGGSEVESLHVEYGHTVTKPTDPAKAATAQYSYTFAGWYNGDDLWDFENDTITGNVTLTAHWTETVNQYTVTFDSDGGSSVASLQVAYGGKIAKPADPVKAADAQYTYVFASWYNGDKAWDFDNDVVVGNVTLKAHWTATVNQYTVSFDSDGGSEVASQTIDYGSKATKPADPTKEGYTFAGWFDANGNAVNFDEAITGNTVYVAHWNPIAKPEEPAKKGLSGGAIAGIVIGSVVVVGGIVTLVIFLLRKKHGVK